MNEFKEIVDVIPDNTKDNIYKDGIKPVLIEIGKFASLLPRCAKNALAGVEMWCINREFMVKELEQELQKKLESKDEKILLKQILAYLFLLFKQLVIIGTKKI